MIDLGHVTLMILALWIGAWTWRGLGLRDRALGLVRSHCTKADVQLLDESIALTRLRPGRNRRGRLGLIRRYGFEFTVTGERRYPGYIELHGSQLLNLELAPHPFPGESPEEPPSNLHYLHQNTRH